MTIGEVETPRVPPGPAGPTTLLATFDLFISYSHEDTPFAERLEVALGKYRPPLTLGRGWRRLRVYRDVSQSRTTALTEELRDALRSSRKLVVVCSPSARSSGWVSDEIRTFAEHRGCGGIIPVLIRGLPHDEAERKSRLLESAFPDRLLAAVSGVPSAPDFRRATDPDLPIQKVWPGWYHLLACVFDVSREQVEQKERRRKWFRVATAILVIAALSVLAVYARRTMQSRTAAELLARQGSDGVKLSPTNIRTLWAVSALGDDEFYQYAQLFAESAELQERLSDDLWYAIQAGTGMRSDRALIFSRLLLQEAEPSAGADRLERIGNALALLTPHLDKGDAAEFWRLVSSKAVLDGQSPFVLGAFSSAVAGLPRPVPHRESGDLWHMLVLELAKPSPSPAAQKAVADAMASVAGHQKAAAEDVAAIVRSLTSTRKPETVTPLLRTLGGLLGTLDTPNMRTAWAHAESVVLETRPPASRELLPAAATFATRLPTTERSGAFAAILRAFVTNNDGSPGLITTGGVDALSRLAAAVPNDCRVAQWSAVVAALGPAHRTIGADLAKLASSLSVEMAPDEIQTAASKVLNLIRDSDDPEVILALATVMKDLLRTSATDQTAEHAASEILQKIVRTRPHLHASIAWERANRVHMLAQAAGKLELHTFPADVKRAWSSVMSNLDTSPPRAEFVWAGALAALAPLVDRWASENAWHALVDRMHRKWHAPSLTLKALGDAAAALPLRLDSGSTATVWKEMTSTIASTTDPHLVTALLRSIRPLDGRPERTDALQIFDQVLGSLGHADSIARNDLLEQIGIATDGLDSADTYHAWQRLVPLVDDMHRPPSPHGPEQAAVGIASRLPEASLLPAIDDVLRSVRIATNTHALVSLAQVGSAVLKRMPPKAIAHRGRELDSSLRAGLASWNGFEISFQFPNQFAELLMDGVVEQTREVSIRHGAEVLAYPTITEDLREKLLDRLAAALGFDRTSPPTEGQIVEALPRAVVAGVSTPRNPCLDVPQITVCQWHESEAQAEGLKR